MARKLRYFILVYGLLCAVYYAYQHVLIFKPEPLPEGHIFNFPKPLNHTVSVLSFDENTKIDIVKFRQDDTSAQARGVVLFFHGNRSNVEYYARYATYFTRSGYEVWMPDYPGFGRSTGKPDMENLEGIALQLYKMARVKYSPEQVVIYGKSLGSGLASFLASERDCRHLLLETPYYSLTSVIQSYGWFLPVPLLSRYPLSNGSYFSNITAPVTIMAAKNDTVIPLRNTLRLLKQMKAGDAFYLIPQAGHNNLPEKAIYHHVLDSVLAR